MFYTLYDVSVPVMIMGLKSLRRVLRHGAEYAAEANIDEGLLLEKRLWPDMMSLTGQVQRASDTAKFSAVRVGRAENLLMADDEDSFEALNKRVEATIAFLERVDPKRYEGQDDVEVILPVPGNPTRYRAREYIFEFALPNFWFHVTTAYDLLRSAGVPIGKRHYLGWE